MKNLLSILLLFLCINYINRQADKQLFKPFKITSPAQPVYEVTATMYYPVTSQCDSDPLVTAGMFKIILGKASEQKFIAMSRDMIERWGGNFAYGDSVQIIGAGHKDGVYKVVDTMNKRFKNRIDFLEDKGTKFYKFENVKLVKTWSSKTKTENQLASL